MDITELKKISDKSYDVAVAKQNALEKADSRLLFAHNGHLFKADAQTINLIKTLSEDHKTFYVLDQNKNPALIEDSESFLKQLKQRNQESLNAYHETYQQLSKLG